MRIELSCPCGTRALFEDRELVQLPEADGWTRQRRAYVIESLVDRWMGAHEDCRRRAVAPDTEFQEVPLK